MLLLFDVVLKFLIEVYISVTLKGCGRNTLLINNTTITEKHARATMIVQKTQNDEQNASKSKQAPTAAKTAVCLFQYLGGKDTMAVCSKLQWTPPQVSCNPPKFPFASR